MLIYQYGKKIKRTNNKTKYCRECAREIEKEQERKNAKLRMRRMRERKRNVTEIENPENP